MTLVPSKKINNFLCLNAKPLWNKFLGDFLFFITSNYKKFIINKTIVSKI